MSVHGQSLPHGDATPEVHPTAFVAPGAFVIGRVSLGESSSVWYGAVLRGDTEPITIGARTNVQDGSVFHADPGFPATVGEGCVIGHKAIIHGCEIEDNCLIGMNATVLNGALIGAGSLVAAGSVVLEGTEIPPRSLVAGVPGKVRRELTEEEYARVVRNAEHYRELVAQHRVAQA